MTGLRQWLGCLSLRLSGQPARTIRRSLLYFPTITTNFRLLPFPFLFHQLPIKSSPRCQRTQHQKSCPSLVSRPSLESRERSASLRVRLRVLERVSPTSGDEYARSSSSAHPLVLPLASLSVMAAAYIRNGAKRIYIASRKLDDLQRVADQLSKLSPNAGSSDGPACVAIQADISSKAGCDALANEVKKRETELDILVNNAGLSWGAPMDDFPEDKGWDKTFHMNVKSQFYLTVALLPLLEKNKSNTKHASVVNIASTAAFVPTAESGLSAPGTGTWSCE